MACRLLWACALVATVASAAPRRLSTPATHVRLHTDSANNNNTCESYRGDCVGCTEGCRGWYCEGTRACFSAESQCRAACASVCFRHQYQCPSGSCAAFDHHCGPCTDNFVPLGCSGYFCNVTGRCYKHRVACAENCGGARCVAGPDECPTDACRALNGQCPMCVALDGACGGVYCPADGRCHRAFAACGAVCAVPCATSIYDCTLP